MVFETLEVSSGRGCHLAAFFGILPLVKHFQTVPGKFGRAGFVQLPDCRVPRCGRLGPMDRVVRVTVEPTVVHIPGNRLTNRWSQPLAVVMRAFDFMKPFLVFRALGLASVAQLRLVRRKAGTTR